MKQLQSFVLTLVIVGWRRSIGTVTRVSDRLTPRATACLRALPYQSPDVALFDVASVSRWLYVVGWRIISGMDGQDTIEIIVNGDARQTPLGARVMDLVKQLEFAPERLAIELNLSILPRAKWAETELRPGDRLEIVHFVGGG
jgi:sulfur carrier protein